MAKDIKCEQCRFVRHDPSADYSKWRAYECGNRKSIYYKALLNTTRNGDMLTYIAWRGCEYGDPTVGGDAL